MVIYGICKQNTEEMQWLFGTTATTAVREPTSCLKDISNPQRFRRVTSCPQEMIQIFHAVTVQDLSDTGLRVKVEFGMFMLMLRTSCE